MDSTAAAQAMLGGFSQVENAAFKSFVERLDAMHALQAFQTYKLETFGLMGLHAGSNVADVGCGTGEDAVALAARVGIEGRVTGFDLSESMLEQARDRHAGCANVAFAVSAAASIAAPDGAFDAVRADRVLTHVPSTIDAVLEMARITAPGGRIVISEPDMPGCWMTSRDYRLTGVIMEAIAASCRAPHAARDLYGLFRDAKLADVSLITRPVMEFDPVAANSILRFQAVMDGLVAAGNVTATDAANWAAMFEEDGASGRFACGVTMFIVSGTKAA